MQQKENLIDVFALPVHLLVKSQKEAKKTAAHKEVLHTEEMPEFKKTIWQKITEGYKK
jgi:hypothetical protein